MKKEKEQIKTEKQIGLQVKIPGCNEFVLLESLYSNIFYINIKELESFKELLIYKLFQICKYYNVDFNEVIVRQQIHINTSGNCNFNIDVNNGSLNGKLLGQKCKCILCNSDFIAIRRTIKICNSKHFFNCIDIYNGSEYEKEVQKWNFIYKENGILYLEGKSYSCKSNQVSVNNMITLFNHTNKMQNMTTDKRLEIIRGQKERGNFWLGQASYEERVIVNTQIAKYRMENETHNWLWKNKNEEQRIKSIENGIKTKKKNGIYEKMTKERIKITINYINKNIGNIKLDGSYINYLDFDKYDRIPGVWSLWSDSICLTCGQTIDLGRELKWTLRVLSNEKLQELEKINPGCTGRWDKIQNIKNLKYKIVNKGETNKCKREMIEAIEAISNNSLYWLPSLYQQSIRFQDEIKEYLEGIKT